MVGKKPFEELTIENPFFLDNAPQREAVARGAYLQDLYGDSENDREEIEGPGCKEQRGILPPTPEIETPKSIERLFIPKEISEFILGTIPLPGKTRFYGRISPTTLGNHDEKGYMLTLLNPQWNREIRQSFGFVLERGEEEPSANEYLLGINDILMNLGYISRVSLEQSLLDINGYRENHLRKEKMDEIRRRGKDKIPLMREFLVVNFPHSHYGRGDSHDLSKRSATAIEMNFNRKYGYVKGACNI